MNVKLKVGEVESNLNACPHLYLIHVKMIPVYEGEYPPNEGVYATLAYNMAEKLQGQLNELVPKLRKKIDSRHCKESAKT